MNEDMRTKLTDIISTMDQYNGVGKYSDEYYGGEKVDIDTDMNHSLETATITEEQKNIICEMLYPDRDVAKKHTREYVLSYDEFISEQKRTPLNVQSYFGGMDEVDMDEEE